MPKVPLERAAEKMGPPPNPDLLKKDPMAEFFGPGSGMKIIGEPQDQMPDEVRAVLEEYGLSNQEFKCILYEVPPGSNLGDGLNSQSSANTSYLKGWIRSVPSMDWIAKNYGPGIYLLVFTWRLRMDEPDPETGTRSKPMRQEVTIQISEKLSEEFRRNKLESKIKTASEVGGKVKDALIEQELEGKMIGALSGHGGKSSLEEAKNFIKDTIETVKSLGIPIGQQQARTIEWEKILPAVISGVTAFLSSQRESAQAREESFNKLLMLMLGQNNTANSQLIEVLKATNGSGAGNQMIKEFTDVIKGAINLKELVSPQQETLADKLFRVVETVAPQILSIAASAAQARASQNNPMVKAAKGYIAANPEFQALKTNPAEKAAFIQKMDNFFGWKQTDTILAVAGEGWDRPMECPRQGAGDPPVMGGPVGADMGEENGPQEPIQ